MFSFYEYIHSFIHGEIINNKYPRGAKLADIFIPQTINLIKSL